MKHISNKNDKHAHIRTSVMVREVTKNIFNILTLL